MTASAEAVWARVIHNLRKGAQKSRHSHPPNPRGAETPRFPRSHPPNPRGAETPRFPRSHPPNPRGAETPRFPRSHPPNPRGAETPRFPRSHPPSPRRTCFTHPTHRLLGNRIRETRRSPCQAQQARAEEVHTELRLYRSPDHIERIGIFPPVALLVSEALSDATPAVFLIVLMMRRAGALMGSRPLSREREAESSQSFARQPDR
jgi:hypothetical protein